MKAPFDKKQYYEYDHPSSFDLDKLMRDLNNLVASKMIWSSYYWLKLIQVNIHFIINRQSSLFGTIIALNNLI